MVSLAVAACMAGVSAASDAIRADQIDARQGLWPAIRWRVFLVLALLCWIGGISVLVWLVDKPPLEQPVSLDPPGVIDNRIRIPLRARYFMLFEFSPQGHSTEQLKKSIGDPGNDGVPIAISWSLTSSRTKAVSNQGTAVAKVVREYGDKLSGWVGEIDVEPGQYQFRARILSPVPQLASIPARLEIRTIFFKMSGTWQSSLLFLGALLTLWIITPAVLFLLGWTGRVCFGYLRSRMSAPPRSTSASRH